MQLISSGRHLLIRLSQSPYLLGWLLFGIIMAFLTRGLQALGVALLNLILLGCYALLIKMMTTQPPAPGPVSKPKLGVALGIGIWVFLFQAEIILINPPTKGIGLTAVRAVNGSMQVFQSWLGLGNLWPGYFYIAAWTMLLTVFPAVVMFLALKCDWRDVGLKPRYWGLTGILLGLTILLGMIYHSSPFLKTSLYQVVAIYFVLILVKGLPEELLLRGFILPRMEVLLGDPINAIVLMSIIFTLLQIPYSIIFRDSLLFRMNINTALYYLSPLSSPTGLIWGYLYLRTRSIVPGILWHTANGGILGNIFFVLH